jgi:VWFA-related protein
MWPAVLCLVGVFRFGDFLFAENPTPANRTPQKAEPTLRVDVRLVVLNTQASRPDGQPVLDLKKEDFRVFEDEQEMPISVFAATQDPAHIALVVDTSGSTVPFLPMLKKAAQRFVDRFGSADSMAVYDVGPQVMRVSGFIHDQAKVKHLIGRLNPSSSTESASYAIAGSRLIVARKGGTLLYDGLDAIVKEFPPEARRTAILVFTDGVDLGSDLTADKFGAILQRTDVPVYAVMPAQRIKLECQEAEPSARRKAEDVPKSWCIVLNGHKVTSEDESLQQEIASKLLTALPADARVWMLKRTSNYSLLVPEADVYAKKTRPLSPVEARQVLSEQRVWRGKEEGVELRLSLRLDRGVLFASAQDFSKDAGIRWMKGTYSFRDTAIVMPMMLRGRGDQACVVNKLINERIGASSIRLMMMARAESVLSDQFTTTANETGGLTLVATRPEDLDAYYDEIAGLIRSSYAIGYYTQAKKGRHTLRVEVSQKGLTVRSRSVFHVD